MRSNSHSKTPRNSGLRCSARANSGKKIRHPRQPSRESWHFKVGKLWNGEECRCSVSGAYSSQCLSNLLPSLHHWVKLTVCSWNECPAQLAPRIRQLLTTGFGGATVAYQRCCCACCCDNNSTTRQAPNNDDQILICKLALHPNFSPPEQPPDAHCRERVTVQRIHENKHTACKTCKLHTGENTLLMSRCARRCSNPNFSFSFSN